MKAPSFPSGSCGAVPGCLQGHWVGPGRIYWEQRGWSTGLPDPIRMGGVRRRPDPLRPEMGELGHQELSNHTLF